MPIGQSATWKILQGHSLAVLRRLESESVQTCITSPPYYGLRAYKTEPMVWDGKSDCEHEWGEFIRQGQSGGTASDKVKIKGCDNFQIIAPQIQAYCQLCEAWRGELGSEPTPELYISHLVEIFREVRRVLKKDGTLWVNIGDSYAGSGCGWGGGSISEKSNHHGKVHGNDNARQSKDQTPPPGTKAKDLIGIPWLLAFALRSDGWYLRSEIIWHKPNPMPESVTDRPTKSHEQIFLLSKSPNYFYDAEAISEPIKTESFERATRGVSESHKNLHIPGQTQHTMHKARANGEGYQLPERRNKRSVWSVNVGSYSEAHFATFPEELITPCVLAGSKEGDTVLDPFSGSGTTGLVSVKYGRNYVGVELNPDYVRMSEDRIRRCAPPLFSEQIA